MHQDQVGGSGMKEFAIEIREVERHQLKNPFANNRLDSKSLESLVESLKEHGQQVPITVVGETTGPWTIIDGMRRFEALGLCEKDTVLVETWNCDVATGLLRVLARESNRKREPLEEAGLIQELIDLDISKAEVAKRLGRSASWVSRRLKLLEGINLEWWQGLREGWLKPWALERVVMPLARANEKHAAQLVAALKAEPLSTRELTTWFAHYEKAPKPKREKMANAPHLFLAALESMEKEEKAKQLADGLEGQCLKDVQVLLAVSRRLVKNVPGLLAGAGPDELGNLRNQMEKPNELLEPPVQQMPRRENEPRSRTNPIDMDPEETENSDPKNSADAEDLEEHGQESVARGDQCIAKGQRDPQFGRDTGTVCKVRRKCGSDTRTLGREADRNRLQHTDRSHPRGEPAPAEKAGR